MRKSQEFLICRKKTIKDPSCNGDIPLISGESELSLTRTDVMEAYHSQNVSRNFHHFESFVLRMARSQALVKECFQISAKPVDYG